MPSIGSSSSIGARRGARAEGAVVGAAGVEVVVLI